MPSSNEVVDKDVYMNSSLLSQTDQDPPVLGKRHRKQGETSEDDLEDQVRSCCYVPWCWFTIGLLQEHVLDMINLDNSDANNLAISESSVCFWVA